MIQSKLNIIAIADYSAVDRLKNGLIRDHLIRQLESSSLEMILS